MLANRQTATIAAMSLLILLSVLPPTASLLRAMLSPLQSLVTTVYSEPTDDSLELLRTENASLRQRIEVLGAEASFQSDGVLAEVISFSQNPYERVVTINKGSDHGVKPNSVVLARGSLVGFVTEVRSNRSTIQLISDPNFRAIGVSQTGAEGVVRGKLSQVIIEKVPSDGGLEVGHTILTSSLNNGLPANIPIGTVIELLEEESGLLVSALINTPVDISDIGAVTVLEAQ